MVCDTWGRGIHSQSLHRSSHNEWAGLFFLPNHGHFLWYLFVAFLPLWLQKGAPAPVPTYSAVVNRMQHSSPLIHKDTKTRGSSRFNISKNREIQKLPLLKGTCLHCTSPCELHRMMLYHVNVTTGLVPTQCFIQVAGFHGGGGGACFIQQSKPATVWTECWHLCRY